MDSEIKVRVKFFASAREIVGHREVEMRIKKGTKANDLLEILIKRYPDLNDLKDQLILAVNKQTGKADKNLKDGDEIAVLPPVTGG